MNKAIKDCLAYHSQIDMIRIMNYDARIFPANLSWPHAIGELDEANYNSQILRLIAGTKRFEYLPKFERLKRLWCFDIKENQLKTICECKTIEQLHIENLKTDKLSLFSDLPNLEILSINTCSQAMTLDDIGNLLNLRGLGLIHFSKVYDLTPLSKLINLIELAVAGSMWKRMKIQSLMPLRPLQRLEFLHLTNIKPDDESLRPLENLTNLKVLDLANFYPMQEFARLAGILTKTNCTWFQPYIHIDFSACKKCGKQTMLMLSGKRKPMICRKCDTHRLDKHVAEFEKTMNLSVRQNDGLD